MKGYLTVYLTQPQECPDDPGIIVPDIEILKDHSSYCYHPTRGFSGSVVVENIDGHFIGWMSVDNLPGGPYKDVKEWISYLERRERYCI